MYEQCAMADALLIDTVPHEVGSVFSVLIVPRCNDFRVPDILPPTYLYVTWSSPTERAYHVEVVPAQGLPVASWTAISIEGD